MQVRFGSWLRARTVTVPGLYYLKWKVVKRRASVPLNDVQDTGFASGTKGYFSAIILQRSHMLDRYGKPTVPYIGCGGKQRTPQGILRHTNEGHERGFVAQVFDPCPCRLI
jgi:hypothetical protein